MVPARNAGRARLKQSPKNEIVVEEIPGGSETQAALFASRRLKPDSERLLGDVIDVWLPIGIRNCHQVCDRAARELTLDH
jgi:hypothetical protein